MTASNTKKSMIKATQAAQESSESETTKLAKQLAAVLMGGAEAQQKETKYKHVSVKRLDEPTIAIPQGMPLGTAADWLLKVEKEEQALVNVHHEISCYPLDGAVAFYECLLEIFGMTESVTRRSFFGDQPPVMISVRTGVGPKDIVQVPWGRIRVPGLTRDEYLETGMNIDNGRPRFVITGRVRKANEKLVRGVAEATEMWLKNNSIYQGQPLRVDLSWILKGEFDPLSDGPEFMDVESVDPKQLILNGGTELAVEANVFGFVRNTDDYLAVGEPLTGGVLLAGKPGTGKTLTARVLAKLCHENGWTFLYLKDVKHLAAALRLAALYETPTRGVVVFAEDIDRATAGQRTSDVDAILNTISGVDGAGRKTLTVVTTNDPESINKAMLRAGRMDSYIEFGYPVGDTVARFFAHYAGEALAPDQDFTEVIAAANQFPPAFIEAVVRRARRAAIGMYGRNIKGMITAEMLRDVAIDYQSHVRLAGGVVEEKQVDTVSVAIAKSVADFLTSSKEFTTSVSRKVWTDFNTGEKDKYKAA